MFLRVLFIVIVALTTEASSFFNCTFDEDLCDWTQAQDDDFDWERMKSLPNTRNTTPTDVHRTDWYMSANSKDHLINQKARLVSPVVNVTVGQMKCFQFYYLMHGAHIGTLNIYLSINGTVSIPVWSRSGTQGIFYLQGQVTVNNTTMVIVEGSGSSGNTGDLDIDNVSIIDGPCTSVAPPGSVNSLACDFELPDICGYNSFQPAGVGWQRSFGGAAKTSFDHTTMTAQGAFMTVNGKNGKTQVSLKSENVTAQGMYCLTYFYRMQGTNDGLLSASLMDFGKNKVTQVWEADVTRPGYQWNKAQLSLNISSTVQVIFDATLPSGNGVLSIDDISVANGVCQIPPDCNFDNYDLCSWSNDLLHDDFDWEITTFGADAQIFAPWRDADNNTKGGFILLAMDNNPSKTEAYLVSEFFTVKGAQCFEFDYYPMTKSNIYENVPMQLNLYAVTGNEFPGSLLWSYSVTKGASSFSHGKLPLQIEQDFRLVIGGYVSLGQVLSLDKFLLSTNNCTLTPVNAKPSPPTTTTAAAVTTKPHQSSASTGQPSVWDCDFETYECHWIDLTDNTTTAPWERMRAGIFLMQGPQFDHTKGRDGYGYFLTVDRGTGKLQSDTFLHPNTTYCLVFWLYLYGPTEFEFRVETTSTGEVLYKHDSMDRQWHQMMLNLPASSTPYNVQFIYSQKNAGTYNQVALDDIHISEGQCTTEVGPDCTFERGYCGWENVKGSDFTLSSGGDPDLGMITVDHTTETGSGFFIKSTTVNHSESQASHFSSPRLPFSDSVCIRFFYFVTPLCDSTISMETLGPQDRHPVPLLDLQDIIYGTWQQREVTLIDPKDVQVLLTVTVGHNKSGEVGFDDITFVNGECLYIGSTDFENGFDVFHNVYSNDFNWVIASPSDGDFDWLPRTDYSTNSPQGHFAVASYNFSDSAGKKAELWSQLSPKSSYQCTSFHLYVYGKDPGMLNVTLVDYMEDTRTVVWSYSPTPGDSKQGVSVRGQFPHVYPGKFFVVFTVVLGTDGGWALDSIQTIVTSACRVLPTSAAVSTVAPPPTTSSSLTTALFVHDTLGECDFEDYLCQWYIPNDIYFNWNRTNGDSTLEFAPKQGRPGGKSYFITLPKSASKQTALLRSPMLNYVPPDNSITVQLTLRFWLNMAGLYIGQFIILLNTDQLSEAIYYRNWATNSWEQIEVTASVTGPFYLMLEGIRGSYDLDSISVDDIEISFAAVEDDDTVYKCTFESPDVCGFQQDGTSDMTWEWSRGSYELGDHTTMLEHGSMVLISFSERRPGDTARLISKSVPPLSGCLTLWLLMTTDGSIFRVYSSAGNQEELLLQKQGQQGNDWVKVETPVSSNVPFTIVMEAELLQAENASIAVDDFSLSSGACNTQGACSFERDMCTWLNVRLGDDFDWIRGSGNTVGAPGPVIDSTLGSPDGYYMYIDASVPYKYQQKAWLHSEVFPLGIQCLHFQYNMRGVSVGTLNVYTVLIGSENSTLIWSLSGSQGNDWKSAMVTVGTNRKNYFIRFEGALGFSVTSNIAIDDIMFLPDACDTQPAEAKVYILATTTSTTTVTKQSTRPILQQCNFDDVTICGFQNGMSDNTWVLSGPNMLVSGTLKPFNGHTSSSNNCFIYAQVGNGLMENAKAQIISPAYAVYNGEPKCLEFYYHMNGDQLGHLNVYIVPDGQENSLTKDMLLWSQDFDAGPGWSKGRVPILQSTNYRVVFEAIRSKFDYYYGIDDLTIFDSACEPPESCDFEDDFCLWNNDGGETDPSLNFYWTRYQGLQRTITFAPVVDHTSQTLNGYYLLVESSLSDTGSVARLYSQAFKGSNNPYCLHFWYYMFGNNLGSLRVYVRNSISSTSYYSDAVLWELDRSAGSGAQGDEWYLAQVNISKGYTQKPFMIIIEATVGSTLEGAFGIDDTQFEVSDCGTQPTAAIVTADAMMLPDCDFEDGTTCGWTTLSDEWFKFAVTDTGGNIPLDHSGSHGKFILADSTKFLPNTSVLLHGPLLAPTVGTSCLTFWYLMQLNGMSELSLTIISEGSEVPIWKASPEKSYEWLPVRINIQKRFDYKLLLIVKIGNRDAGSVAVDDIKLVHGACQRAGIITFENDLSGFIQTSASTFKWTQKLANDSFANIDHTYHTPLGHILLADLGSITTSLKTAEIQSPLYPSAGDECVEFWYNKKGSTGGWLNLEILESAPGFVTEDSVSLWMTQMDTNGNWNRALVDISSEYPYWMIFQAAANNSQVNDAIAIDDISFKPHACPSPVTCDFDVNTCDYASPPNNSVYWQAAKGVQSDSLMPVDQTLESGQGMYMAIDFPFSPGTYEADLISPLETQPYSKCLFFWYYGSGEGMLQVFVQTSSYQRQSIVTLIANKTEDRQYRSWYEMQADVNSTVPYSIVFHASSQVQYTSFAIDSISLVNGTCASLANQPGTQSPTSSLDPKKAVLGCDFENSDFCNFTDGSGKSFSWKLFSFDSKHSPDTGVDFDHTRFNKYGHHVYMDASGHKFNTTAQLISPSFVNDKYVCLSFYYAMYGRDVNRLNVYVAQDQTSTLYWTLSGNQGKDWHHQMVEIGEIPQPTQIIFEGVVGNSNEGDIDLDDIWIFYGKCPAPEYCDFEDSEICNMDQDNLDDAQWVIRLAALASGSEPTSDHTYGTGEGHYLLLDMSGTKAGDDARIFTQQYNANSVHCLSFWFHFSNPLKNSHNLTVSLQDERGIGTTLIVLRGFFEDDWTPTIFPLHPTENFQVVFEGQSAGSKGNIALDDIRVSPNECEVYIDCDFEAGDMCGWEPVPEFSNPPWEVVAPYGIMTLNFTNLPNNGLQVSKIESQIIPPGLNEFCFTCDFKMYGSNVGFFNISVEMEYPVAQSIVIFSRQGDQGQEVFRYAIGDSPRTDLGISRFVITGSTQAGGNNTGLNSAVILVSGIKIIPQSCDDWMNQEHSLYTCKNNNQITPDFVCDFVADCSEGEDEQNCGTCDFETDYCNWKNDGTGAQQFTAVSSIPNIVFTDAHPGKFLTLQRTEGISGGYADLVLDQELGRSPYNCTMIFSYYMSYESQLVYGNLFVSIEEDNVKTVVWESSFVNSTNWQTAHVDIGSIHLRFKLHFTSKFLPFDNAMGIDDIKFSGCSYAEPQDVTCGTKFKCMSNNVCIDNATELCDFTYDCQDESDEDSRICGNYLMDNFEESLGDWSQDVYDDFDWSRHSGNWISSDSGLRRDHTLGTHSGHYLIFEGGTHADGQTARLISPEFLPSQTSDCVIRFYYHLYGSNKGQLTLYIRSTASGAMQQVAQYFTTLNDAWLFGSSILTSGDNFQVVFEGKVVGLHSTDIGLDDITFTPQCQLKNTTTNSLGPEIFPTTVTTLGTTTSTRSTTSSPPRTTTLPRITTSLPRRTTSPPRRTTTVPGRVTTLSVVTKPVPVVTNSTRVTTRTSTTLPASTVSESGKITFTTEHQATIGAYAASPSSDSWKTPVGVVLGLLAVAAVIIAVFIYLKRTHKLTWVTFPFLRRGITTVGGESSPIYEYETTGDIPIQMDEQEPISGTVSEVFGESTEQDDNGASGGAIVNPVYIEPSKPELKTIPDY